MTEEERLKYINERAAAHIQDWLGQLEKEEVTEDQLLASLYGAMVVAYVFGYYPHEMATHARDAADRLITLVKETEESLPPPKKCKNVDENGNCPLHNLHCQYPDCEK